MDLKLALDLYEEIYEILEDKVFVVRNKVTSEVFIKKKLSIERLDVYKKLKGLKNVNRAEVINYFEAGDKLIVIEEFVNGRNLENILLNREMKRKEAIDIVIQVCKGLKDIHNLEEPIIHRDIKPSNIMLSNEGVAKIIDFDVSRIHNKEKVMDTTIMGTIGFAPQEQLGTGQTDTRSDIYSIGVLLNFLLLKKYPTDETPKDRIGGVIRKATQLDKNYRYRNLDEFIEALQGNNQSKTMFKESKRQLEEANKKVAKLFKPKKDLKKSKWRKSLEVIPGFKGNFLTIIISCFWFLVGSLGFFIEIEKKELDKSGLFLSLWMIITPFVVYRDLLKINKFIPFINSKNKIKRFLGYVLYWFILIIIWGILTSF